MPARFGPYEVIGPLGAGGMGEVYRAKDHRLKRDVAVKFLPPSAASSPDRQRRFAQEAVAASALNHPNILVVYDVGVEGDTPYLVSELIDGISLRREMEGGRVPIKRLIDVALQIAEGLAAAHEAGIVHRDVKPENMMVTRDGRIKILDFGLAKNIEEVQAVPGQSLLTQSSPDLVVGTVPYMSPEQARGARIDFRSDQFSLGIVLYELATGTHPFHRDTAVQTLSAIMVEEPPPLSELNPALPVPLRWLIARLLAKNPRERYAHTADIAADLRTVRDHLSETIWQAPAGRPGMPRRAIAWSALGVTIAGLAFVLGRALAPPGVDLTSYKFTPLANDAGFQGAPSFSPDGKSVAYVAEMNNVLQVFTRDLASSTRFQVTYSKFDCRDPFWAPDGNRIYFHSLARDKDALWYVSPTGGQPEPLIDGAARSAMSPDGQTLAVLRQDPDSPVALSLWFASPPDTEPVKYQDNSARKIFTSDGRLQFSPDGSRLLLWLTRRFDTGKSELNNGFWVMRPPNGELRPVLPSLSGGRLPAHFSWLNDNRQIVFVRDDGLTSGWHLWVANVDTDEIRPLTATSGNEGSPSLDPDGTRVAFTAESTDFDLVFVPIDGSAPQTILSSTRNELDPAWSPIGSQHAFVTDRSGRQEIWLRNQDGEQRPIVTEANFEDPTAVYGSLAFSPDGQKLAYQRMSPATGWRIWISTIAGTSPVRLTTDPLHDRYQDAPTWSRDGNWIAFAEGSGSGEWSLFKVQVGGRTAPKLLKKGVLAFARPQWSPDEDWIVCATVDGLEMISSDGDEGKNRVIGDANWMAYAWSEAGDRLYGLRPTGDFHHFMLVAIDIKSGTERIVNPNIGAIPQANQPIRGFSRIGARGFGTSVARVRSDIWLLEGLKLTATWRDRLWPF